jgi:hypothetical protein
MSGEPGSQDLSVKNLSSYSRTGGALRKEPFQLIQDLRRRGSCDNRNRPCRGLTGHRRVGGHRGGLVPAASTSRTAAATATASMNQRVRGDRRAVGRAALDPRTAIPAPPPAPASCSAPPQRRSAPHARAAGISHHLHHLQQVLVGLRQHRRSQARPPRRHRHHRDTSCATPMATSSRLPAPPAPQRRQASSPATMAAGSGSSISSAARPHESPDQTSHDIRHGGR